MHITGSHSANLGCTLYTLNITGVHLHRRFGTYPSRHFGTHPGRYFDTHPRRSFGTHSSTHFGTKTSRHFGIHTSTHFGIHPSRCFGTHPIRHFGTNPSWRFGIHQSRRFGTNPSRHFGTQVYILQITDVHYAICISRMHILLNSGVHCTFGKPRVYTLHNVHGFTLRILHTKDVHSEYHGCTPEYYGWRLSVPRVYILNTTGVHSAYHACTFETSTNINGRVNIPWHL